MDDKITIKQLERSYKKALADAKKPYQRVFQYSEPKLEEPKYAKPPSIMRGWFGVKDEILE
jgi:hypothetical protein